MTIMNLCKKLVASSTNESNACLCFMVKKVILCLFMVINIGVLVHYSIFVVALTDDALHQLANEPAKHYVSSTVKILITVLIKINHF